MQTTRRTFLGGSVAFAGASLIGAPAVRGQGKPKVVVIGGGAGGATAARYIAKDSKGAVDVTLVEEGKTYQTCFFSNLYLGGYRSYESIVQSYDKLASAHGIRIVQQRAARIERDKKLVVLADGSTLPYDRLIVAPGIDLKYDSVPGWSREAEEAMPHAWKPGRQTQLLKARLDAVPDGGVIVMIAPPNPYRCPPGPYERVSMMAHALKSSGRTKAKIIVLDPKDRFSKMALFQEGWEKHYPGMVEWMAPGIHDGVKSVDPKTNKVVTGFETYDAALVNVIPAQMAGAIAREAGLAAASGFCAIDPATMRSTVDPAVFVLGDAAIAGDMPKSAFSANSQAKVAAMIIRSELTDSKAFPARYANTCWSLIETDDCVKVGGRYEPTPEKIKEVEGFVSKTGEAADVRKHTYEESLGWYAGITADTFG